MIYKLTSVKRVISKVFTDLDLKEGDHRLSDMLEWAGEALSKIGGFPTFANKVMGKDGLPLLEIVNYQAALPNDFYSLIQVAYSGSTNGPFYPMRYGTGSFDHGTPEINEGSVLDTTTGSDIAVLAMNLYNLNYADALAMINYDPIVRAKLNALMLPSPSPNAPTADTMSYTNDVTYVIVPGYIKTNVSTGYLTLAYQAIPTDDEGYPLIPDDVSFEEAIYWYINMKLTYPDWKMGRVRDAVYYDTRNSWNFYRKQAYATAMMPNIDQMESIKNAWLRLVPEINEHSNSFSTLGERQIIYNQNK